MLYLALEDGDRRLQERCRALLQDGPIPALFHYLTRVPHGQVLATIAAWLELHGDREPVVILDTLGKAMPPSQPGESAYSRDYRIASALKRITDDHPGTAMVVVHHDRKAGSEDFVDAVSGTHGLAGAADTVVVLARPRGEQGGLLKVTGRDVSEAEYAVDLQPGQAWQLAGANLTAAAKEATARKSSAGLGDRSADVLTLVQQAGSISPREVAEQLGIDNRTAGTYLGRLADTGRITKSGRGRYTPVGTVETVESAGEGADIARTLFNTQSRSVENTDAAVTSKDTPDSTLSTVSTGGTEDCPEIPDAPRWHLSDAPLLPKEKTA